MFFNKAWEVLIVDDEPDVIHASKLMMKHFTVYGLPLQLHTAASKAEAIAFLNKKPELTATLAVAFIDVVMETDTAGLELCQHIRETIGNKISQIYIRTGQPGVVPERTVIDQYEIGGYFTKVEVTENKLYSLVKSGIRQFYWASSAQIGYVALQRWIAASATKQQLEREIQGMFQGFHANQGERVSRDSIEVQGCVLVDGKMIAGHGWDEKTALATHQRLDQQAGQSLGVAGDKFVRDETNVQLIKVAAQPTRAEVAWLFKTHLTFPEATVALIHQLASSYAQLWQTAA